MIRFINLTKKFGAHLVLDNVNLDLAEGQVHFIVGFSGAGKSVLIRHAVGLLQPDSGQCFVDDLEVNALNERQLSAVREKCQMVFQHATLFDSLTLQENIAMPLRKRFKIKRDKANAQALEFLDLVGCADIADLLPGAIGQGTQKCVAIARAMAMRPKYILFDEPTTGLPPPAARHTDQLIQSLCKSQGVTAIVVSHDMTSVRTIAESVHFLYDAHLCFSGKPEDFFTSQHPVIQSFVSPPRPNF